MRKHLYLDGVTYYAIYHNILHFLPFIGVNQVLCVCVCCSNDGTEFGGSIYQKVNGQLETAINLAWTAGSNNTRFGIAAKYQLDKDSSIAVSLQNTLLSLSSKN